MISRSSTHCVDANVVLRLLVSSEHPAVEALWDELAEADADLIAPSLLTYEVSNALHRQRVAGLLTAAAAEDGLRRTLDLPIALHGEVSLHGRALELAGEYRLPAAYDAHYLALAERFRAPLWTYDRRLAAAVGDGPRVHLVG